MRDGRQARKYRAEGERKTDRRDRKCQDDPHANKREHIGRRQVNTQSQVQGHSKKGKNAQKGIVLSVMLNERKRRNRHATTDQTPANARPRARHTRPSARNNADGERFDENGRRLYFFELIGGLGFAVSHTRPCADDTPIADYRGDIDTNARLFAG